MIKLYTTDSYFNIFTILNSLLEKSVNGLDNKNVVFSEAKISLMIERSIASKFGGSFNTDVYSFGKYLSVKHHSEKVLSKEGSAMVIKRLLSEINLNCFRASKTNLAPSLFDLIIQLKSAGVTPDMLESANLDSHSVLKEKLSDITRVFSCYEEFIKNNGYDDQSSLLSYLPEIIEKDEDIKNTDVYLVGYTGFTAQARSIVKALVKSAKSVTFILTEGKNEQVFVNETASFVRILASQLGERILEKFVQSDYSLEGKELVDCLFLPKYYSKDFTAGKTDRISLLEAKNPLEEIERVAETIKSSVMKGENRYKDFTIAVSNVEEYSDYVKKVFNILEIPYYLDEKKNAKGQPLVSLIISYVDVFRKNFERKALISFMKNPFYSQDKSLIDSFENYLIKNNVNFANLKKPFNTNQSEELIQMENLRKEVLGVFSRFDVEKMLSSLSVKEKTEELSLRLKEMGEVEESAINSQVYQAVIDILEQMKKILGQTSLSLTEFKNVFLSGISALELSIIPQYNDAVFVGGYKEVALAKSKNLFLVGLTSSVPEIRQDVALLSDGDIDALEQVKVLIEPKISIINRRARENFVLALGAFSNHLYLSYPLRTVDGSVNQKTEILSTVTKRFTLCGFESKNGYLTKKQGLNTFASDLGAFVDGSKDDIIDAYSFYQAEGKELSSKVVEFANSEIKSTLSIGKALISGQVSPTTIEDYFHCPYKAFLSHSIRLKRREEDKVDALSVGNLMHDVFKEYADRVNVVEDEESSDALFLEVLEKVIKEEKYAKYLEDCATKATVDRVVLESKKYCYKIFASLKNSDFKVSKTEASFGDRPTDQFKAISLNDGKIKLCGKIDRVDESDNYYRVVDYKTGKAECTDKLLFSGLKLQLFLYAAAVEASFGEDKKKLAGIYYLPVSDKFNAIDKKIEPMTVGKTLGEDQALLEQDKEFFVKGSSEFYSATIDKKGKTTSVVDEKVLKDYIEYAKRISEKAAERIDQGVIVPSPIEGACEYCEFKVLCPFDKVTERKINSVEEQTIIESVGGETNE